MESRARGRTILCVDDKDATLALRKPILEQCGYLVVAAHTSSHALRLFQSHAISLVIADHKLRGGSGLDLAMKIKELNRSVPIVMLSGTPPETMANIDCFIDKTEPVSHVLALIRDLIERSSPRQP